MLVCDATDTMRPALVALKTRFHKMVHCLRKQVPGVRIGLVTYRDSRQYDPEEFTYQVQVVSPLTGDMNKLYQLLLKQTGAGGGDIPEAVHEGLQAGMEKAGWSPQARRVIVLMGDAPPHKEDDGLKKVYKLVEDWRKSSQGFLHTIDTTGYGKHLGEFKELARHGGGVSLALPEDALLAELVTICVLGPKWADQIRQAYRQAPGEEVPLAP